ncbi:hypothetical protein JL722_13826 [Aureococcus anophagefferens]|nr:hypothetical protein JL722_13826 [Aureococcus anophagefferens]
MSSFHGNSGQDWSTVNVGRSAKPFKKPTDADKKQDLTKALRTGGVATSARMGGATNKTVAGHGIMGTTAGAGARKIEEETETFKVQKTGLAFGKALMQDRKEDPHVRATDAVRRAAAARDPSMADFAALAANAKKAPNVKNAVLLLKHMRAHKVRRSDLVVTYGGIALRNAKRLGDDAWAVYEQTLLAALDVDDQPLAKTCGDAARARAQGRRQAVGARRAPRGLVAEARGDWDGALAKATSPRGRRSASSTLANLRFADAIFCYEELTLFDPLAQHYHRRLGELYYSLAAANAKDAEPRYRHAQAAYAGARELQVANAAVLDAHAPPYARLLPAKDADPQ